MPPRVLVTGAGGFIGSATVSALLQRQVELRLMAHRRPVAATAAAVSGIETVRCDLAAPETLRGCCDGVDVLLHLAAEVGSDQARCTAVNMEGTRALFAEAERAGVRDALYLSTAAVHGLGPHRGLPESAPAAPVSPASRTRREAELIAAASGAVVVRPAFVYGEGDRWYVPALLRRFTGGRSGSFWFDHGRALHSVVGVEDLAAVLAVAAEDPRRLAGGVPYHVCEPGDVTVAQLVTVLAQQLGLQPPRVSLPWAPVRAVLGARKAWQARYRRAELFAQDHSYAAPRVWAASGVVPGGTVLERLPKLADWYGRMLRGEVAA